MSAAAVSKETFRSEVRAWAEQIGVEPKELHIRPMRRKWGNCSTAGRVSFNTALLRQPAEFRKQVIVHEMVRLKVSNRGQRFRALLRAHLGSEAAKKAEEQIHQPPPVEPAILSRGKKFHKQVQDEWSDVKGAAPEVSLRDMKDRRRRIDILVDEGEDWVSIIEIKRTAWDRIHPDRVRPNALRHARQLWTYIEPYLDRMGREVCPGIIYENVPKTPGRIEQIEEALHERAIQVVWQTESKEDLKARLEPTAEDDERGHP